MSDLIKLPVETGKCSALEGNAPRLHLKHSVFKTFDDPFFRISEVERRPVIVIRLDDREASLPISGMMREFSIHPADADGVMLHQVCCALEFVTGLRIGDRLPSEILTGKASWTADEAFHDRAMARFNLLLLAWTTGKPSSSIRDDLAAAGMTPVDGPTLKKGLRRLADQAGGIDVDEVMQRIQRVAHEFAHIDSLRNQLLRGAQRVGLVLDRLAHNFRGDQTHKELLMQVRRLAKIGVADIQARFDAIDAIVADIVRAARSPDELIGLIRLHRDQLYVRNRAWDPYNMEWATIEAGHNARTWHLANETYRFLAPRFMTAIEWRTATDSSLRSKPAKSGMDW